MEQSRHANRVAPPPDQSLRFEQEILPLAGDLHRHAIHYTMNRADAEDLVQETLLKAFKAFRKLGGGTYCKQWLLTIMRNTWISIYRAKRCRPAESLIANVADHQGTAAVSNAAWEAPSAEQQALRDTFDADLRRAILALPEQLRKTTYFVAIEGMKPHEVAKLMGIPLGTVLSRMHRSRQQLRQSLADSARRNEFVRPPTQHGRDLA